MNDRGAGPSPGVNNNVRAESVPFARLPGQSRLFLDYQRDPVSLRRFYPNSVGSVDALTEHVPAVLSAYSTDRSVLASALTEINAAFGAGSRTFENIQKLEDPDTVAIVTGQQAGLFTGPLYTVYKAMTAVKMAECLSAKGQTAVPIFWIATEDHDLDEVSKAFAIDAGGALIEAAADPESGQFGLPVGEIKLGRGVEETVETFLDSLPRTEFTDEVRSLLRSAWRPDATFGTAFGSMLAKIFEPYGLVFIDPLHTVLKSLASPLYVRAIERSEAIVDALTQRGNTLVSDGYHAQVLVEGDYFPLFWHTETGVRSQLRRGADGKYRSKEDRTEFSLAELAGIAAKDPKRFSPGVMLRAAVQDFLLPTLSYIGGAAEIAYFAQSSEVYRILDRPVTPIVHRQSFTIIEPKHARTLAEYGLEFTDLFGGIDALLPGLIERKIAPGTDRLFDDVSERIGIELGRLDERLANVDPTLAASLERRRARIIYHLEALRRKTYLAEFRKNDVTRRRVESCLTSLLPAGGLQERTLNIVVDLNKYGTHFIKWVYEATDPEMRDHRLLYL